MKNLLLTTIFTFLSLITLGQTGFNFQAVLRDDKGKPRANESVTVRFEIMRYVSQTSSYDTVYIEQHYLNTTEFGVINTIIGDGQAVYGRQSDVVWYDTMPDQSLVIRPYAINVRVNGELMLPGSIMQYVPYARVAESALNVANDKVDDADADPLNEIQKISIHADSIFLENGGFVIIPKQKGEVGFQNNSLTSPSDTLDFSTAFWSTGGNVADSGFSIGTLNNQPVVFLRQGLPIGILNEYSLYLGHNSSEFIGKQGQNIVLGNNGLSMANSSNSNSVIGYLNLGKAVTATANVSVGNFSLTNAKASLYNVSIGVSAGENDTVSTENVYVGYRAGEGTKSKISRKNVMIGSQSGLQNEGDQNIFIGYGAGFNDTASSNTLVIGFRDYRGELIRGNFQDRTLAINGSLTIDSSYTFPKTDGSNGQFLATDGSGNVFWKDVTGVQVKNDTVISGKDTVFLSSYSVWKNDGQLVTVKKWDDDINLVFGADSINNNPASTDDNSRLMYIKNKAAFRSGYASAGQNNNDSIGVFSFSSGYDNKATSAGTVVTGGYLNEATDSFAVVSGGSLNKATNNFSIVGGGVLNTSEGVYSGVHSGLNNKATGNASAVLGGTYNKASDTLSVVGGGISNEASAYASGVLSGSNNVAKGRMSVVGGGNNNSAEGVNSTIAGGNSNVSKGNTGTISGGYANDEIGAYNTIGGGYENQVEADYAVISGGISNQALGLGSSVSGGYLNEVRDTLSSVNGGLKNLAMGDYATVGGGSFNQAVGRNVAIAGGDSNTIGGDYSFIGSGKSNSANSDYNSIGGGRYNHVNGDYSAVSGGLVNIVSGQYNFVGGGDTNVIQGTSSVISGGRSNAIVSKYAVIPGGYANGVLGEYGFASGRNSLAASYGEVALGYYNTTYSPKSTSSLDTNDRLFVIGNGTAANRHDALVLSKNNHLHLNGNMSLSNGSDTIFYPAFDGSNGQVLTTDGSGKLFWTNSSGGGASGAFVNDSSRIYVKDHSDSLIFIFGAQAIDNDLNSSSDDSRLMYDTRNASLRVGKDASGLWNKDSIQIECTYIFGKSNQVLGNFNSILGGESNRTGDYVQFGFIGNGIYNTISGSSSAVITGSNNNAGGYASLIGSGDYNTVQCEYGVIVGGVNNELYGNLNSILGGSYHFQNTYAGVITGGLGHKLVNDYGFVGAGSQNYDSSYFGVIVGGSNNYMISEYATIVNGDSNYAMDTATFIGGGNNNMALRYGAFIAGGDYNKAYGKYSTTGSGNGLIAQSYGETVFGSFNDTATSWNANGITSGNRLFVLGNGSAYSSRSSAFVVYKNGNALLSGTLTQSSDARLKKNITPIRSALTRINALEGVNYNWNGLRNHDTSAVQYGFIAQQVREVLPDLVQEDDEGYLSVNYTSLIPVLVEAIKELQQQNNELSNTNSELRNQVTTNTERLEEILKMLQSANQ
ncbi:MAG: hypothetical protein GC181_08975 [Bacteroidetes bacterium]|nr:hypothetical protein [Bacteroidota bacterium]